MSTAESPDPGDEFARRTVAALAMGGPERLGRRRAEGRLDARARVARLFDPDSFVELGLFAASGDDPARTPADGKVTGYGTLDGRAAAVVANDFTVFGASSTPINGRKIAHVKRVATDRGMPIVFLGESSGARIPESMGASGMGASGGDPTQYMRLRETPWAAAVLGSCYGSSSWYTCLSDFKVMRKGALMSVSSPRLVEQATGQAVEPEALGGWRLHYEVTGLVDVVVDTDEEAIDAIKRFLSYLPSHSNEAPPVASVPPGSGDAVRDVGAVLPASRTQVYDVRRIIRAIVDRDSFFELKAGFGKSATIGLARIDGHSVGFLATNPLFKGGALEVGACQKMAQFLVLCDSFNIPVVSLVDTPGFGIGLDAERAGAPARIMSFMSALQLTTMPKISVILRKTYGQAYLNMGGGRNSDEVAAWPSAEVGFMAPGAAVAVLHGLAPGDPGFAERAAEVERETSPWLMAANFAVQHVIRPEQTRDFLARTLAVHRLRRSNGVGRHLMQTWPCYL